MYHQTGCSSICRMTLRMPASLCCFIPMHTRSGLRTQYCCSDARLVASVGLRLRPSQRTFCCDRRTGALQMDDGGTITTGFRQQS